MTACELQAFHNKTVSITFLDGEVSTARLTCSDDECEDVMVDVVSTNRPDRYTHHHCSYIVPASEFLSVTEVSSSPAPIEAPAAESIRERTPVEIPTMPEDAPAQSLAA